jgi:hypothetical protein
MNNLWILFKKNQTLWREPSLNQSPPDLMQNSGFSCTSYADHGQHLALDAGQNHPSALLEGDLLIGMVGATRPPTRLFGVTTRFTT